MMMQKFALALLVLVLVSAPVYSSSSSRSSSYSTKELFDMTLESLKYDVSNNTAYVRGVGRIADNSPSSLLLARRAALVDAQRGMLLLKKSIKDFRSVKNVSGHVPALRLLSESTRDGLYFVEVEAALSDLLSGKNIVNRIPALRVIVIE